MPVAYAARWRPVAYRSTIEAVIIPASPVPSSQPDQPPTPSTLPGWRVQTLQLIVFDNARVGAAGNPYRPGDPATEQHLAIVEEVQIQLDIAAFAGKTYAQAQAMWDAARDAQIASWRADPHLDSKVKAAAGGALSAYVVLG